MFLLRFENNYFSTIESKLRFFLIRLIMRSKVTNIQLSVSKLVAGNKCVFYLNELKTLLHVFSDSSVLDKFWNDLSNWLSAILKY